jgi:Flp pilus assembly protein TadD
MFYFQLGAAHERAGHLEEAESYLNKALELAPEDTETLNYLGYMWADKGVRLDEAKVLIERALKLEPKNAAFLDSLAWVLFRQQKFEEALAQMEAALANLQEPDATIYDHQGDILAALGRMDEARKAWAKSLELEPNDGIRRKLEGKPLKEDATP